MYIYQENNLYGIKSLGHLLPMFSSKVPGGILALLHSSQQSVRDKITN